MRAHAALAAVSLIAAGCATATFSLQQTRYADGQRHEVFEMRNGVRHGKARAWHPNGTLASEGDYVAGKREGKFVFFSDDGTFAYQAIFVADQEVWRSTDPEARPNMQHVADEHQRGVKAAMLPTAAMLPVPWFSSLDRTTSLHRVGAQLGIGGPANLAFGSARRYEVFGNYTLGDVGAYGQFSRTALDAMSGTTRAGRQTLEGGGTYRLPFERFGTYRARLGVLVPVSDDDAAGFSAATAGAFQRPTDAASSVPSTIAMRTSANLTRTGKRFVFQADLGVDWLFGGAHSSFDALARANLGVGFGSRSALLSVESTNTVSISDLARRIDGVGVAGAVRVMGAWVSALLSTSISGDTAITAGVGYEL